MPDPFTLSPLTATPLFLLLIFCGRGFRQNWKAQAAGPAFAVNAQEAFIFSAIARARLH